MRLEEWFHIHGFKWNQQSASATCEDNEITLSKSITGITLSKGDDKEIDIALRLISKLKWKKLYCLGDEKFLLKVMLKVINEHSCPSLEQVTAKLHKVEGKGFSESDDWAPIPRPRHNPEPRSHDNGYEHSGPG